MTKERQQSCELIHFILFYLCQRSVNVNKIFSSSLSVMNTFNHMPCASFCLWNHTTSLTSLYTDIHISVMLTVSLFLSG